MKKSGKRGRTDETNRKQICSFKLVNLKPIITKVTLNINGLNTPKKGRYYQVGYKKQIHLYAD